MPVYSADINRCLGWIPKKQLENSSTGGYGNLINRVDFNNINR
jgi:hypothetical protein